MVHDPNQLFVCSTVRRYDIASELNDTIECSGMLNANGIADAFKADDERLTEDRCNHYAKALGDLEGDEDTMALDLHEFCQEWLEDEFGFKIPGVDDDDVRKSTVKLIAEYENILVRLRAELMQYDNQSTRNDRLE